MKLQSSITPQQLFSEVATPNIQRSTFPRNHFRSGTFDAGLLIPLTWDIVYPGDTMKMDVSGAIRYNTLIKPIQANQFLDLHAFFVPMRLIHDDFPKLMGEQIDPDDSIDFTAPIITIPAGGFDSGTQYETLGVPIKTGVGEEISAYVLRAIAKTYNRWFATKIYKTLSTAQLMLALTLLLTMLTSTLVVNEKTHSPLLYLNLKKATL